MPFEDEQVQNTSRHLRLTDDHKEFTHVQCQTTMTFERSEKLTWPSSAMYNVAHSRYFPRKRAKVCWASCLAKQRAPSMSFGSVCSGGGCDIKSMLSGLTFFHSNCVPVSTRLVRPPSRSRHLTGGIPPSTSRLCHNKLINESTAQRHIQCSLEWKIADCI